VFIVPCVLVARADLTAFEKALTTRRVTKAGIALRVENDVSDLVELDHVEVEQMQGQHGFDGRDQEDAGEVSQYVDPVSAYHAAGHAVLAVETYGFGCLDEVVAADNGEAVRLAKPWTALRPVWHWRGGRPVRRLDHGHHDLVKLTVRAGDVGVHIEIPGLGEYEDEPHGDFFHGASFVIGRQRHVVDAVAEALRDQGALAGDRAEQIIRSALDGHHDQAHWRYSWGGPDSWVAEQCNLGNQAAAQHFITNVLSSGPVPTRDINRAAEQAEVSWNVLLRVQRDLGIQMKVSDGRFYTFPPGSDHLGV
jgi:hypothetical protein